MPHQNSLTAATLVVSLLVGLIATPFAEHPGASPEFGPPVNNPTGDTFPVWRDHFNDSSNVSASSRVVFTGSDVRLPLGNLTRRGPVLTPGPGGWDAEVVGAWSILHDGGIYKMWHNGCSGGVCQGGYATSPDGFTWTKRGIVLPLTLPEEGGIIGYGDVIKVGPEYRMWYTGFGGGSHILAANSTDGVTWNKQGVVLSPGAPGEPDSGTVWRPTVVYVSGTYYMWYTGRSNPSYNLIFLATSLDGLQWTKRGVVLSPGSLGAMDSQSAAMPSVRLVAGRYLMAYTGYDGADYRLLYADSLDGVVWQKTGSALSPQGPDEWQLSHPALMVEPNGTRLLYYASRPPNWQVYLATNSTPRPISGWIRSRPVAIPSGMDWAWFNQSATIPSNTSLNATLRDAASLAPIPGFENLTAGAIELSSVIAAAYPELVLEAWLHGDNVSTPILDAWEVGWADRTPPVFQGLMSATDRRTGGSIRLTWSAATDPSVPLSYFVYQVRGTESFDFLAPNYTTSITSCDVTGLTDGVTYRFVVRASDSVGNREANNVVRDAIPTHPWDDTPPEFAGAESVVDLGTGERIRVTWQPAMDSDTPESNVDPSLPITYSVYLSLDLSTLRMGIPSARTNTTTIDIVGLESERTYYVLVRATDAAGNEDANLKIMSIEVKTPLTLASFWWIPVILVVLTAIVLVVVWRRRWAKVLPTPPQPLPPSEPPR